MRYTLCEYLNISGELMKKFKTVLFAAMATLLLMAAGYTAMRFATAEKAKAAADEIMNYGILSGLDYKSSYINPFTQSLHINKVSGGVFTAGIVIISMKDGQAGSIEIVNLVIAGKNVFSADRLMLDNLIYGETDGGRSLGGKLTLKKARVENGRFELKVKRMEMSDFTYIDAEVRKTAVFGDITAENISGNTSGVYNFSADGLALRNAGYRVKSAGEISDGDYEIEHLSDLTADNVRVSSVDMSFTAGEIKFDRFLFSYGANGETGEGFVNASVYATKENLYADHYIKNAGIKNANLSLDIDEAGVAANDNDSRFYITGARCRLSKPLNGRDKFAVPDAKLMFNFNDRVILTADADKLFAFNAEAGLYFTSSEDLGEGGQIGHLLRNTYLRNFSLIYMDKSAVSYFLEIFSEMEGLSYSDGLLRLNSIIAASVPDFINNRTALLDNLAVFFVTPEILEIKLTTDEPFTFFNFRDNTLAVLESLRADVTVNGSVTTRVTVGGE